MIKILLMMMCLLISGCGLFKKTVKTSSSIENTSKSEVKSENNQQIKIAEEGKVAVKSKVEIENSFKINSQVRKDVDENTEVTADNIEIDSDGSLKASGNAKYTRRKNDKSKADFNKENKSSQVLTIDSNATKMAALNSNSNIKNSEKQLSVKKAKTTKTTSTSDFSWIIWFVIALGMVAGGFILGKWLVKKLSPLN